ncbi:MAG: D-alanine--D-alanine ligase family protein [Patescibacteria group bacterium]|jgi:D-alanine-D-alanine ligase
MKTIALFFGGLSNEAEVSIMSARNVVKNFDYRRYKLVLIYWRKQDGYFYQVKNINKLGRGGLKRLAIEDFKKLFDVALLMTHGRFGEDGVLQAILESQKIKYCGCRVLGSALCMDKAVFKDLLKSAGIDQVKYLILDFNSASKAEIKSQLEKIKKSFKLPLYIKPANSGSSVGITRVEKTTQLDKAIKEALKHDTKIVVEEGLINPKEIEMAVLGNEKLLISRPGELRLVKDFYNYDDKYKLGQAQALVPAKISLQQTKKIRQLAERAYRLANCQGFARIDFFISRGKVYLNEINTLPGFTDISMYPMLMMDKGMSYQKLLNKIIELAY